MGASMPSCVCESERERERVLFASSSLNCSATPSGAFNLKFANGEVEANLVLFNVRKYSDLFPGFASLFESKYFSINKEGVHDKVFQSTSSELSNCPLLI